MTRSAVALALLLAAPTARAQAEASAGALFDRGLAEMKAKNHEKGCPALAESHRLDPRLGTLFTLAECEAQWGKLASAVAHYRDFIAAVQRLDGAPRKAQNKRLEVALAEALRLAPEVPNLTVVLPEGTPAEASVELDGLALGRAALEAPIPVNPGKHAVTLRLADGSKSEVTLEIAKGEKKEAKLALPAPAAKTPAPPKPPAPRADAPSPAPAPPPREAPSSTRTWGWLALGVGAAGVVAGTTFGALAWGRKSTIEDNCSGADCNETGLSAADRGQTWALLSTVSFAVGVAGAGTGVVLLSTGAPSSQAAAVPRGLAVRGRF
ncbi:MAG: hypothetical protein IT377_09310 [Polyangiaceae bacterium]|nr:hypothetical protein [Polyangiaceae bacterium]